MAKQFEDLSSEAQNAIIEASLGDEVENQSEEAKEEIRQWAEHPLANKKFAVGSSQGINAAGAEVWHSSPIDYSTALSILLSNGWTEEQANEALAKCPEEWIPVNDGTNIC